MKVGLSPGDFVLDGDPAPSPSRELQFSAHFYCGQTAGCTKMPLGTEVDLAAGNILLDGVPALPERDTAAPAPFFRPMSIVATVVHLGYC